MSRSTWKPAYTKLNNNIVIKKKKNNKIFNINMIIKLYYLVKKLKIYNGTRFFDIEVKENIINHKYGDFSP